MYPQRHPKRKRGADTQAAQKRSSLREDRVFSLYLMYNDCSAAEVKTRTYIGCAEDVQASLLQHNGITEGGPRQTRKAQGHWQLLCTLVVPPSVLQQVSLEQLQALWRGSSRGVERRMKRGLQLCRQYGLYFLFSTSLLDSSISQGWNLSELITEYHAQRPKRQLVISLMRSYCQGHYSQLLPSPKRQCV